MKIICSLTVNPFFPDVIIATNPTHELDTTVSHQNICAANILGVLLICLQVSIISANIMVIVDNGLSERATLDFRLARNSCEALLR